MCNFLSWIEQDGRRIWNTDALIEEHGLDFEDGIGHSVIRKIWGITSGKDRESISQIPPEAVADVNGGKCRKMMLAGGFKFLYYNKNGESHRIDGPAIVGVNGDKFWYKNGKRHRIDGPAVERADGYKAWYKNGVFHRINLPAVVYADGTMEWYKNGKRHRIDGPAVDDVNGGADGYKAWYKNDKLHRIDGPAVVYADGTMEWYKNDEQVKAGVRQQ